eukprot:757246-Hanusia_phi.AAC.3
MAYSLEGPGSLVQQQHQCLIAVFDGLIGKHAELQLSEPSSRTLRSSAASGFIGVELASLEEIRAGGCSVSHAEYLGTDYLSCVGALRRLSDC